MINLMKICCMFILGLAFSHIVFAAECLNCHTQKTPAAVKQWQASAHSSKVDCADCHGTDHDKINEGTSPVDAKKCGTCHEQAFHQHINSRHGLGLHAGWGCSRNLPERNPRECRFCHEEGSTQPRSQVQCARFLKQTTAMVAIGCNRCHQVENSCASCHTNHLTDIEIVRRPEVCATCHMGPDHPQWEMWQTSRHGLLYTTLGDNIGPTCQRCHMPAGNHDVSIGITMSPGMKSFKDDVRDDQRTKMLAVCGECHGDSFSRRELANADAVHVQSQDLVKQAMVIVQQVADLDLLVPSLQERPEHPLRGQELVLDNQMLYEDISHIERLFFKMKKFDLAKTVKGAYHQNPAYTHWYGNAELKMTLVDINAEAARLTKTLVSKKDLGSDGKSSFEVVESQLKMIKRQHERGTITDQEYQQKRAQILKTLSSD